MLIIYIQHILSTSKNVTNKKYVFIQVVDEHSLKITFLVLAVNPCIKTVELCDDLWYDNCKLNF